MNTRSTLSFLLALVPAAGLLADDTALSQAQWTKSRPAPTADATPAASADVAPAPAADTAAAASAEITVPVLPTIGLYANCDGSTVHPVINSNDLICFVNQYALGGAYANCDGSTVKPVLTANDFVCFLNAYTEALLFQEFIKVIDPTTIVN